MSAPPLANRRHERFCLMIAADLDATSAYELAGFKRDDSNAAKLLKRRDVKARIEALKGGLVETKEPDASPSGILAEIKKLALDPKQPAVVRARLLTYLSEVAGSADGETWPASSEDFDIALLSDRQRALCLLYGQHLANPPPSPLETIMSRLAMISARVDSSLEPTPVAAQGKQQRKISAAQKLGAETPRPRQNLTVIMAR